MASVIEPLEARVLLTGGIWAAGSLVRLLTVSHSSKGRARGAAGPACPQCTASVVAHFSSEVTRPLTM